MGFIKRHKKLLLLALFTLIVFILFLNVTKEKISVTSTSWNGWDKDYVPNETTDRYTISPFKTIKYKNQNFSFTALLVNRHNIVILTNQPMSEGNEHINLNSKKRVFIIKRGETLKLTTPTTDGGEIYIFSLE